jgi:hypothetical protein
MTQDDQPGLLCGPELDKGNETRNAPVILEDGRLLTLTSRKKLWYIQERAITGAVVSEHALAVGEDGEGFLSAQLINSGPALGLLSTRRNKRSGAKEHLLFVIDSRSFEVVRKEMLMDDAERDFKILLHQMNMWIPAREGAKSVYVYGYGDKMGTDYRFCLLDERFGLHRKINLDLPRNSAERIEEVALSPTGDLFLIKTGNSQNSDRRGNGPTQEPIKLIRYAWDGGEKTETELIFEEPGVVDVTFAEITSSKIVLIGVRRDLDKNARMVFTCDLATNALVNPTAQGINWQQVNVDDGGGADLLGVHDLDLRWQQPESKAGSLILVGQSVVEWVSTGSIAGSVVSYLNYKATGLLIVKLDPGVGGLKATVLPSMVESTWAVQRTRPFVKVSASGNVHVIINDLEKTLTGNVKEAEPYSYVESQGQTVHWKILPDMLVERQFLSSARANKMGVLVPWNAIELNGDSVLLPKQRYNDPITSFCSLQLD